MTEYKQRKIIDRLPHKGQEYSCSIHADMAWPIIRSLQTGKEIIFQWRDLISLARLKGIDFPESQPEQGSGVTDGN